MTAAAVIGTGRMGRVHLRALLDLGVEVVAIADSRAENLDLGAELCPAAPQRFATAEALVAAVRPDLVAIATTAPSHAEAAMLAIRRGVPTIVCEKPFTTSLADGEAVVEEAARQGTVLAVNHQMRFMEQYVRVHELLQSGRFGTFASMNVLGGNFGLAMNGSHYLEAFRFLSGAPVATVRAQFDANEVANPRGPAFRDRSGVLSGTNQAGQRFHLDASADQGHGMAVSYGTTFGRIDVDELAGLMRWVCRKPEHRGEPSSRYGMPWEEGEIRFQPADNLGPTRAVYRAVLDGEGYPTAAEGLAAVRILAAAYLSHEQGGRPVHVDSPEIDRQRTFAWA